MRADAEGLIGIGLVLNGTGLICLDYDDHEGDKAEAVALGGEFIADILAQCQTYAETSVQGKGQHVFYRATLPHGLTNGTLQALSTAIYARRFIAITGNTIGWPQPIADGQALVDSWNLPAPAAAAGALSNTVAIGQRLDLTDDEVGYTLSLWRPTEFKVLISRSDMTPKRGEWWHRIIGDLDKITGNPTQIDRMIRHSPAYQNAYNAERYDEQKNWLGKQGCASMLEYWLKHARSTNKEAIAPVERLTPERRAFLKQVMTATIAYERALSGRLTEDQVAERMAIVPEPPMESAQNQLVSSNARELLRSIVAEIPGNYEKLTPPPGATSDFVSALAPMLTGPRLTYMLPAVIATLSGYLGQTFKVPGLNAGFVNNFIIAGQMNTGKTSTMTIFNGAIDQALSGYYRDELNPTKRQREEPPERYISRMLATTAKSVQGLFDRLSRNTSVVWFADEAESQLRSMMNEGDALGVALKSFYKKLFDASKDLETTELDASRASSALGIPPIVNLTVASYFACTSEVFAMLGSKEIYDGTFSRANLIYDETPMSAEYFDETKLAQGLPLPLLKIIQRIARVADDTNSAYAPDVVAASYKSAMKNGDLQAYRKEFDERRDAGASRCVTIAYAPETDALRMKIGMFCKKVGNAAQAGKMPEHYQLLSRCEMRVAMIAGLLATVDAFSDWCRLVPEIPFLTADERGVEGPNGGWRDTMPQVVVRSEHYQWAFEYTAGMTLRLFEAWDNGRIAVSLDSVQEIIVAAMKSNGYHKGAMISVRDLCENHCKSRLKSIIKSNAKFAGATPDMLIKSGLKSLHEYGVVILEDAAPNGRTRKTPHVTANVEDPIWALH